MNISVKKTISAFSLCLDIATHRDNFLSSSSYITFIGHHDFSIRMKLNTFIVLSIAEELKLCEQDSYLLYVSSILKDFCSNELLVEIYQSENLSIINPQETMQSLHKIKILRDVHLVLTSGGKGLDITDVCDMHENITSIQFQIITLSRIITDMYDSSIEPLNQCSILIDAIKPLNGSKLSPLVCSAFFEVASKESFWLTLFNIAHFNSSFDYLIPKLDSYISLKEFEAIANIFASIIDNKSPFTIQHSKEISDLAYNISCYLGYDKERCTEMKIAGLLHDIGKIAIPPEILDKDAPLTKDEFNIIKAHPFYTKLILDRIEDIPHISLWASSHHEKLNGKGYPCRFKADDLTEECRILCVCDIYQALTADRPYRKGLYIYEAFDMLYDMAYRGLICKNAVDALKNTLIYNDDMQLE